MFDMNHSEKKKKKQKYIETSTMTIENIRFEHILRLKCAHFFILFDKTFNDGFHWCVLIINNHSLYNSLVEP